MVGSGEHQVPVGVDQGGGAGGAGLDCRVPFLASVFDILGPAGHANGAILVPYGEVADGHVRDVHVIRLLELKTSVGEQDAALPYGDHALVLELGQDRPRASFADAQDLGEALPSYGALIVQILKSLPHVIVVELGDRSSKPVSSLNHDGYIIHPMYKDLDGDQQSQRGRSGINT